MKYISITVFSLFLVSFFGTLATAQTEIDVQRGPTADWVEPYEGNFIPTDDEPSPPAGNHILLYDEQVNTRTHEVYKHSVSLIQNREAVDALSDVVVEFHPAYQTLEFHFIRIHRNGSTVDKLRDHEVQVFQREEGMEWGMYDGAVTAVVNLRDVRPGDILEYAYTASGVNPLMEGHVVELIAQQAGQWIGELKKRVIVDRDLALRIKMMNGAVAPENRVTEHGQEYSWSGRDLQARTLDNNLPSNFNPLVRVQMTSFREWKSVVDWALPLYELDDEDLRAAADLAATVLPAGSRDERILAAIRFVQDEIRYLGRFEGLWALQPRQPSACITSRFGDCKDKSLLLVALLRHLGIDAYPVLLSSYNGEAIIDYAPSPYCFDHCVVGFELDGKTIYIDPTFVQQGGGLQATHFPDYDYVLPIRPASSKLVELPDSDPLRWEIDEHFEVAELGSGEVRYEVVTRYFGAMANNQREYFSTVSLSDITQGNLEYYSHVWPGIASESAATFSDDDREGSNLFEITEAYLIRDAWTPMPQDTSSHQIEFYSLMLENHLNFPGSPARTMPYSAGTPVDLSHRSTIVMPQDWEIDIEPTIIGAADIGFEFTSRIYNEGATVHIDHTYRRTCETVAAEDVGRFVMLHDNIRQELGLALYDQWAAAFRLSGPALIIFLLSLGASVLLAVFAWRRYDPQPADPQATPLKFGGWLYFVAFGMIIRPVAMAFTMLGETASFDQTTWELAEKGLTNTGPGAWKSLLGFEIFGTTFLFVLSILVAIQFFRKRSSLPRLYVAVLATTFVYAMLDMILAYVALPSFVNPYEQYGDVFGAFVGLAIWGPYFMVSERVRDTFLVRREAPERPLL